MGAATLVPAVGLTNGYNNPVPAKPVDLSNVWEAAFCAGRLASLKGMTPDGKIVDKAQFMRRLNKPPKQQPNQHNAEAMVTKFRNAEREQLLRQLRTPQSLHRNSSIRRPRRSQFDYPIPTKARIDSLRSSQHKARYRVCRLKTSAIQHQSCP